MKRAVGLPARRPVRSVDPVGAYAHDICTGKITAGRLVRLACERHFQDLAAASKHKLVFSPEWALHAINFFPNYLRHSKGEWGGHAIELAPWQEFIIGSVFGWFRKDGTRRFRFVYEEVARKQGKSTIASGIGIYGLVADREPGAEVYTAATMREQARIVFGEAQRMVRASPQLRHQISIFKLNMSVDRTASKFEPLSSDDKTLDGLNPHFVLIDELHKHRTRAVLDVLTTALGSRRQPLLWIITTAGDDNPESVYAKENAYAIQVLEGVVKDDAYFSYIATLDKDDKWDDPKVWIKANPNLHVSIKFDYLKSQALKAAKSPASLVAFKRLHLNIRTSDAERAINMDVWRQNTDGPFDPATMHGRQFFGAIDLSTRADLTAWVKLFPPIEDETRWHIVPRFWIPSDSIEEKSTRDRVQYQRWVKAGLIEPTMGEVIDHNEVMTAIIEDCRLHEPISIAYDPWNAHQLARGLSDEALPVFEFIQGIKSYTAPCKELDARLVAQQFDHGGNEVMDWMASNLMVQVDKNLNRFPSKKHSIGRIDGIIALLMCIGRSMVEDERPYGDGRRMLILE